MVSREISRVSPGRAVALARLGGWALAAALSVGFLLGAQPAQESSEVVCVIVSGLGGMPEYEENFLAWAEKTEQLCLQLGASVHRRDARQVERKAILGLFSELSSRPLYEMWLFLIGHGNFDGERFKFNIKGPDLTDADLSDFLGALPAERVNLVAATSASGALLARLEAEGRVVVTATRNQYERQPPLFFSFFVEAAGSPEADSNKDGRVSLLEAFLFSRQQVAEWYEKQGRIQTEHAVLSEHGGKRLEAGKEEEEPELASGAGWLSAAAFISRPPERAYRTLEAQELGRQRTRLERAIEDLKFRKGDMPQQDYFQQLEKLLVQLAETNEQIERLEQQP